MKKIILLRVLFTIAVTFCCYNLLFSQLNEKITTCDYGLNGKVKILNEKCFKVNKVKQDTNLKYELVFDFNDLGFLKSREGFGQTVFYAYNSQNKLNHVKTCAKVGKSCMVSNYIYDKNGNLTKQISKFPVSLAKVAGANKYIAIHYFYNKLNKLIQIKEVSKPVNQKNEVFEENQKFEYDSTGNILVKNELNELGTVFLKIEYKYSDIKLIETSTLLELNNDYLWINDFFEYYDYSKLKSKITVTYELNSKSRIAKMDTILYTYEFDDNNRLIKEKEISNHIKIKQYCDFDNNNNWRKKIVDDYGDVKIIQREYYYY